MPIEIYMPKMSDHMEKGKIIRWLVRPGEDVQRGQVILELETDKAVGEVEAPEPGRLAGVRAAEGAEVAVGETLAYLLLAGESEASLPNSTPWPATQEHVAAPLPLEVTRPVPLHDEATSENVLSESGIVPATPVARRLARELGVDLHQVRGSGPGGRVKEEDVRAYADRRGAPPEPAAAPRARTKPLSPPGPVSLPAALSELVELSHIQQLTGQRMLESVHSAPHFYLEVTADMTRPLDLLETQKERILAEAGQAPTVTGLLVRVVAAALQKHPRANACFEDGKLRQFSQVNIGVAVGTPNGLVVPVIHQAEGQSLAQITRRLAEIKARAAELRFSPQELAGGTFTITNLGMYGVDRFAAIINPPQSAILAVGRINRLPAGLPDGTIGLRPLMVLTLSVDHRVLDGIQAALFLAEIQKTLEQPYALI